MSVKRLTVEPARWTADQAGTWLCLLTPQARRICDSMKPGKLYDVEIKLHRARRSLDANAYFWVLADKLAEVQSQRKQRPVTKVEIYRQLIPDIPGNSTVLAMATEAVPMFCKNWESRGAGWLTETMPHAAPGFTTVTAYYGSSTYDTHQMSKLIDLVIAECKEQDIETMTPEELARLEGYNIDE